MVAWNIMGDKAGRGENDVSLSTPILFTHDFTAAMRENYHHLHFMAEKMGSKKVL